jgi:DNA-binding NarL/FixJ family response regulator
MRKCRCQHMRGTILVLQRSESPEVDVELLRTKGLIVHLCRDPGEAVGALLDVRPDVVVATASRGESSSIVGALRGAADRATSIIVLSEGDEREAARQAGADSFVPGSAPAADLHYVIHRALILRRSGRRLVWDR